MTDIADRVAAAWLNANTRLVRVTPGGWYGEQGGAVALVSRCPAAAMNLAVGIAPDPDPTALEAIAAQVATFQVPWALVVRSPSALAAAVATRHGLDDRGDVTLMACSAAEADLRADEVVAESIRPVRAAAAGAYTDAMEAGFEVPAGTFGSLMGGGVLDAPGFTGYLAGDASRPTGTGLGLRGLDMIGVYNITVVPQERGRGLGRAMTARVLRDGFTAGATTAYLQASAAGRPLYESMGFTAVDTWTMWSRS